MNNHNEPEPADEPILFVGHGGLALATLKAGHIGSVGFYHRDGRLSIVRMLPREPHPWLAKWLGGTDPK